MSEYLRINGRFNITPSSIRKYHCTTVYYFDYSYPFQYTHELKDKSRIRLEIIGTASCSYSIDEQNARKLDTYRVEAREITTLDGEEWATEYIEKHCEDLERELAYHLGHGFIDHFIKDVEIRSI